MFDGICLEFLWNFVVALLQRPYFVQVGLHFPGSGLGSSCFEAKKSDLPLAYLREALLDLDRQEGCYNYEDWPVDNDQQPEWLNNLDGGSSSSGESQDSGPQRLRPPYSSGM